jgi:hypothetical protein
MGVISSSRASHLQLWPAYAGEPPQNPNPSNQSGRKSGKMKKTIPTYEEAKDELGEDAMSFFMDMVRQDNAPPDKEEIPPPAKR